MNKPAGKEFISATTFLQVTRQKKKTKNIYPEVKKIFWHVIDKCEMISDMYNLVTCIFPVEIKFLY